MSWYGHRKLTDPDLDCMGATLHDMHLWPGTKRWCVLEVPTSVCLVVGPALILGFPVVNNAREYMEFPKSLPPWFSHSAGCKVQMEMSDTQSNSPCSSVWWWSGHRLLDRSLIHLQLCTKYKSIKKKWREYKSGGGHCPLGL
jgi:hypothetical protein